MAEPINKVQAAFLWDLLGVSVDNLRPAPRQHQGNVIFCGYADILIWIFVGDNAVPLIQLCGNSIKLIGDDLHFDPKSERGQGEYRSQHFAHWFPTTGAARAVLTRKLAELPEIQAMLIQAKQQLTEATPAASAAGK